MVESRKVLENQHISYFYVNTLDVFFYSVYNILCFTVPGPVVDLDLKPSPHNVSLEWKKPSSDGDCVTRYVISWRHTGSENTNSTDIGKEESSYVIGDLAACVQYEISVSAVNENNERNITAVNRTTETVGK
jgi:hypothetical protein